MHARRRQLQPQLESRDRFPSPHKMIIKLPILAVLLGIAVAGCATFKVPREFSHLVAWNAKIVAPTDAEMAELPPVLALFSESRILPRQVIISLEFNSPTEAYATVLEPSWAHGNSTIHFTKENEVWNIDSWLAPL